MRRSLLPVVGGLLAVAAMTAMPAQAMAQSRSRTVPSATEIREAVGDLIQRDRLTCTYAEGRFIGRNAEGRTLYEVSCEGAPGFLLLDTEPAQLVNCIANNASVAARRAENPEAEVGAECTLAANVDVVGAVSPFATQAGLTCTVDQARWVGATSSGDQRYEVGCANSEGYWIDVNAAGQVGTVLPCLEAVAAGGTCQFTTPQEQAAWVTTLASSGGRTCAATQARFVGANAQTGAHYYEVGCSDGPGFMVRTNAEKTFEAVIECAAATGIAGGCRLTEGAVVAEQTAEQYHAQLASAGFACAYVSAGTPRQETSGDRRTVVEFQCSDRPWGLVAFLPNGAGSPEQIDCLTAQARIGGCTLTSRGDLIAAIQEMVDVRPSMASCQVSDFRFVGRLSAEQAEENMSGDVVELKCAGGEGFVAVVRPERTGIVQSQTCAVSAERGGTRCELT